MADTIHVKIENARQVQDALNAFTNKVARKIVREGVKAAWTPLLRQAKLNARALDSGRTEKKKAARMGHLIAASLVLKPAKKQRPESYAMMVRIKKDYPQEFLQISERTGRRAFIPVAIEYGHAFPGRGLGGAGMKAPKDVAARPYMRKALDAVLPNAPKIFEKHLDDAIREENGKK